jgi:hypothetical protein
VKRAGARRAEVDNLIGWSSVTPGATRMAIAETQRSTRQRVRGVVRDIVHHLMQKSG